MSTQPEPSEPDIYTMKKLVKLADETTDIARDIATEKIRRLASRVMEAHPEIERFRIESAGWYFEGADGRKLWSNRDLKFDEGPVPEWDELDGFINRWEDDLGILKNSTVVERETA